MILAYFILVLVLAVPFYALGMVAEKPPWLPVNLPVSALMAVIPLPAAALLTARRGGWGAAKKLVARAFDARRIHRPLWLAAALLVFPLIYILAYFAMRAVGRTLPAFEASLGAAAAFFALYLVSGVFEEVGWMGYAFEPMQARMGALTAALLIGLFWGAWHLIPYAQAGNSPGWIVGQVVYTVALRVLTVWVYLRAGRSVLAAVLAHAVSNLCWTLFPVYGSHYDPLFTGLFTSAAALVVVLAGGLKTPEVQAAPEARALAAGG